MVGVRFDVALCCSIVQTLHNQSSITVLQMIRRQSCENEKKFLQTLISFRFIILESLKFVI